MAQGQDRVGPVGVIGTAAEGAHGRAVIGVGLHELPDRAVEDLGGGLHAPVVHGPGQVHDEGHVQGVLDLPVDNPRRPQGGEGGVEDPPRAPWAASVVTDLSVHTRPAKRLLRGSSLPRMALKPSAVEGSATHVMVWVEAPAVVAPTATTAATAAASRAATRHRPGRFRGLVCRRSPRRLTSMVSLLLACI